LLNATFEFTPGLRRFPAQTKIQRQLAIDAIVVLDVYTKESIAIVLELSRSLTEREVVAERAWAEEEGSAPPLDEPEAERAKSLNQEPRAASRKR